MADLSKAMSLLLAFRRKFETLLAAASAKVDRAAEPPAASGAKRLREVMGFGSNPGNLRMFVYVPERLSRGAPLVVALHGCSQTADDYDYGAGWSSLADRLGFAVVYPQQQPANNPQNCFSWFSPGDIARDHGESLSIRQMVEHAIASFGLDRRRIFVTGLSAGGAMASVMLATYPEVFAGGAIIAGLPYGCARTVQQAFEAMFTEQASDACARRSGAGGLATPRPLAKDLHLAWHGRSNREAVQLRGCYPAMDRRARHFGHSFI
jgi:poly(hydroxyalkanoate) depolymerase family esterase